jgi:CheY-like chemotaxis protein
MNGKPLQVLVVEDNAGDAGLLREMFSKERPDSFELGETGQKACERSRTNWDVA